MPRIYITNRGGHDFSAAKRYGDFIFMSEGEQNPFQVAKISREQAEFLQDSSPEDYILISGLPITTAIAAMILGRKHGRVNFLQHNARTGKYRSRTVLVDDLISGVAEYRRQ